jgi:hypothetical protein
MGVCAIGFLSYCLLSRNPFWVVALQPAILWCFYVFLFFRSVCSLLFMNVLHPLSCFFSLLPLP